VVSLLETFIRLGFDSDALATQLGLKLGCRVGLLQEFSGVKVHVFEASSLHLRIVIDVFD